MQGLPRVDTATAKHHALVPSYLVITLAYTAVLTVSLLIPADTGWHATRQNVYLSLNDGLSWPALLRDIVVNVGAFIPIGILWDAVLRERRPSLVRRASLLLLGAAAFAFAIESLQYVLAWRASSLIDVLSDTAGTALGIALNSGMRLTQHFKRHCRGERWQVYDITVDDVSHRVPSGSHRTVAAAGYHDTATSVEIDSFASSPAGQLDAKRRPVRRGGQKERAARA